MAPSISILAQNNALTASFANSQKAYAKLQTTKEAQNSPYIRCSGLRAFRETTKTPKAIAHIALIKPERANKDRKDMFRFLCRKLCWLDYRKNGRFLSQ